MLTTMFRLAAAPTALALSAVLVPAATAGADEAPSDSLRTVPVPDSVRGPKFPSFTPDGERLVFTGTPEGSTRSEIMTIREDGTGLTCLTCGLDTGDSKDLSQPLVFPDGRRMLVNSGIPGEGTLVLECEDKISKCRDPRAVPLNFPEPGEGNVLQKGREVRIAPDGKHIAFTQIRTTPTGEPGYLADVGTLRRTESGYEVDDARVVSAKGEAKSFTHDGQGLVVSEYVDTPEAANPDDFLFDLETGRKTRLTYANDYDEDFQFSPDGERYVVGSGRDSDIFATLSQVTRPNFIGPGLQPVFFTLFNQRRERPDLLEPWLVRSASEEKGELGEPLAPGATDSGWDSRMKNHWSPDSTKVAFWQQNMEDATESRMVVADVSDRPSDPLPARATPAPDWADPLKDYVPETFRPAESRPGQASGSVIVEEHPHPDNPELTVLKVTYDHFSDDGKSVIDGTEKAVYTAGGVVGTAHYTADLTMSGAHEGTLTADLYADPGAGDGHEPEPGQTKLEGTAVSEVDGHRLQLP
ncbi:TolB-like translocation protein [Streptomyces cavernicola]|uniref:Uncharacterized protein n=1 Tax=Streptomyces cavernicola TaxID=3043613 RepID=A0ABT6S7I9_9ACTN|nr:hypothetical protein [Streptomyces sp. B-S-A6]MDI3404073.1 hypothetical protein [Streptomyces sp. B-S-A6]